MIPQDICGDMNLSGVLSIQFWPRHMLVLYCDVVCGIVSCCVVLLCTVLYHDLCCVVLCGIALHCFALYHMESYGIPTKRSTNTPAHNETRTVT